MYELTPILYTEHMEMFRSSFVELFTINGSWKSKRNHLRSTNVFAWDETKEPFRRNYKRSSLFKGLNEMGWFVGCICLIVSFKESYQCSHVKSGQSSFLVVSLMLSFKGHCVNILEVHTILWCIYLFGNFSIAVWTMLLQLST